MRTNIQATILIVLILALSACSPFAIASSSGNPPTPLVEMIPQISIEAADFSFKAPASLPEGWVSVTLTNSGQEPHHVQFLRLKDGVSMEQFQEALKQGEGPALAISTLTGGVGAIAPGQTAQAILNLPAGNYVILCLIASPDDHLPHLAKGMISPIVVKAAQGVPAAEPSPNLTVRLKDFSFTIPEKLPAGPTTIKVINDGPEYHEFNLLKLAEGKTLQDVAHYMEAPDGPPPFIAIGGMNGLDVGRTGYVAIDFQPGTYVAICNIPSPKAEGSPHSMLGMIKEFSVE